MDMTASALQRKGSIPIDANVTGACCFAFGTAEVLAIGGKFKSIATSNWAEQTGEENSISRLALTELDRICWNRR